MSLQRALTFPSFKMHQHSTGSLPSSDTVTVKWNFAFSLADAFAFFCALNASQTPMVVGMPAINSRPMGMVCFE
jgi:hypothetical protein